MEDFKKDRITNLNSLDKKLAMATSVQNSKAKDLDTPIRICRVMSLVEMYDAMENLIFEC